MSCTLSKVEKHRLGHFIKKAGYEAQEGAKLAVEGASLSCIESLESLKYISWSNLQTIAFYILP